MSASAVAQPTPRPTPVGAPKTDLTAEYAAGGTGDSGTWFRATARTWPHYIDDLTRDYGDDLYERLLNDAVVAAAIDTLKSAILEEGVTLTPGVTDAAADGFALAQEIHASAVRMFGDLDPALDDVLADMLSAIALGNRVAELRYAVRRDGGATRLMLAALKVKPRANLAFVVDPFSNVIGLLTVEPGPLGALGLAASAAPIDPANPPPNFHPRAKFAVLTYRPKDADPRGTSVLRPAYTAWNFKRHIYQEYLKYLVQFAVPSLVGVTAQSAGYEPVLDAAGIPTGQTQTAQQALLTQLKAFRNATALAVPYGTEIKELFSQGEGRAFLGAFALLNAEITLAVLGQTLATGEGEHNARAAAQVHQDVLDTKIRQAKAAVVRMLRNDVLRPWVLLNWGEAALPLAPIATLGAVEEEDRTPRMNAVAALERAGWFTPSQRPEVDRLLGLPQRTPEETALETERHQAPPVAPAVAPPGDGGDGGDGTGDGTAGGDTGGGNGDAPAGDGRDAAPAGGGRGRGRAHGGR